MDPVREGANGFGVGLLATLELDGSDWKVDAKSAP